MTIQKKEDRTDKAKNKIKLIKEIMKNPLSNEIEIAKQTGLGKTTVNRLKKELPELTSKSQNILDICAVDFEIVQLGQKIINERLKNKTETDKMRTFEIAQTIEKSEKRYMLFKGKATDEEGGLNILSAEDQNLLNKALGENII